MKSMNKTLLLLIALAPSGALASDPGAMHPGQYEYTMKMEIPGMPFPMPPTTYRSCLTQADVDKGKQYDSQQNKDCETKNLKQSAGKASFDLVCKDGTTGSAEYTFTSEAMSGKTVINKDGGTMTMNMSAKRTGDCAK